MRGEKENKKRVSGGERGKEKKIKFCMLKEFECRNF